MRVPEAVEVDACLVHERKVEAARLLVRLALVVEVAPALDPAAAFVIFAGIGSISGQTIVVDTGLLNA